MIYVLFVDDEQPILDALKRTIRRYDLDWHAEYVTNGQAAIERLRKEHFDVLVTDLQMPGMSGEKLLREVSREFPDITQVIMSGMSEQKLSREGLGSSIQYLSKPCTTEALMKAVKRGVFLKEFFHDGVLDVLLEGLGTLSSVPDIQINICRGNWETDEDNLPVAEITCSDLGIKMQIPLKRPEMVTESV